MAEDDPAFDWERFYATDDHEPGAYVGGEAMAAHLETVFDVVGTPRSYWMAVDARDAAYGAPY